MRAARFMEISQTHDPARDPAIFFFFSVVGAGAGFRAWA